MHSNYTLYAEIARCALEVKRIHKINECKGKRKKMNGNKRKAFPFTLKSVENNTNEGKIFYCTIKNEFLNKFHHFIKKLSLMLIIPRHTEIEKNI